MKRTETNSSQDSFFLLCFFFDILFKPVSKHSNELDYLEFVEFHMKSFVHTMYKIPNCVMCNSLFFCKKKKTKNYGFILLLICFSFLALYRNYGAIMCSIASIVYINRTF